MRLSSVIGLSGLIVSPSSDGIVFGSARSIFSERCSDLCMAFFRDDSFSTSCQQICDALQAQEGEPCIHALTNTTDEQLTLMSYSSGHYIETASILECVAEEANPEYISFVEHLRLHDQGSPEACQSLDGAHYCVIQDPSMSLGLCLPDICNSASIAKILANISNTSSDAPLFAVVCGEESRLDADAGTVLALLFVCFLFSLTAAGTLLDFRKEARASTGLQKPSVAGETKPEVDVDAPRGESIALLGSKNATRRSEGGIVQQEVSHVLTGTAEDETPIVDVETRTGEHEAAGTPMGDAWTSSRYGGVDALGSNERAPREPLLDSSASRGDASVHSPPWWAQCLMCFSLRKNMGKLLAPPSSSNAFGALDGIRTLSNLWVIILHVVVSPIAAQGGGLTNAIDVLPFDGHGALSRPFEDAAQLLPMLSNGVGDVLSLYPDLCVLQSVVILSLMEHPGSCSCVPAQVIHQGTLAVDTFFLMSGFLASVTLLPVVPRVPSGSRSIGSWVLGRYWHRYLRLMPTTAFITLVMWQLYPLFSDGPTWWPYAEALKDSCRRDWWTEITFVQNLVPWPQRALPCVRVAWSLGIEMQFFLGAVPLIALFHYHPRVSVATLLSIMAASCVYTMWFSFYQDVRFPFLHSFLGSPNAFDNWWRVYVSPWFRCPTYIIGVICGMAWHTYPRGRTMSTAQRLEGQSTDDSWAAIDRILVPVGFTTSALLMSLSVFGAYWANRDMVEVQIPAWTDHLFLAFSRPAFASGVALLCGLCFCGRGGVANWFLSLPIWSPLSRLTFCSYLTNWPLFMWLFTTRSVPYRYTAFEVTITFFGVTGVAFISAAVMHLLVEAPFRNLESWVRKRRASKTSRH